MTLTPVVALAMVSGALGVPVGTGAQAAAVQANGDTAQFYGAYSPEKLVRLLSMEQEGQDVQTKSNFFPSFFKPKSGGGESGSTTTTTTTDQAGGGSSGGGILASFFRPKNKDGDGGGEGSETKKGNFFSNFFKPKASSSSSSSSSATADTQEGGDKGVGLFTTPDPKKKNLAANFFQRAKDFFKGIIDRGTQVLKKFFPGRNGTDVKQGATTSASDFEKEEAKESEFESGSGCCGFG
ncbi:hypothetical protein CP533_0500 [Ophiocordyceps camponoti-saundersi (nom. inval.)]|nr:hypothetical protein CP533_0500 [Ophiocordyceps camponoti-saundersi (nom. inval.)]